MTEKEVKFTAEDGKTIYGALNTHAGPKCRGLIIYAHGLPSTRNDYTYIQSSRLFAKLGYDTLRISFYDWQKNARNLKDCGFADHVADLENIISKHKRKYKNIYLIGHSWGGPTIILTNCTDVTAVSLWDPSYNVLFWWSQCIRQEGRKIYLTGAVDCLISETMHHEALSLTTERCRDLSALFEKPLQVIHAKKSFLYKFKESYHTHAQGPTDYHLITKADHCFLDEDALKETVQYTHNWFKKFGGKS